MRSIDPITKGLLKSALFVFVISSLAAAVVDDLNPSTELLRTMAGIGASFFLAYVIEATWLAQRFPKNERSEDFLGLLTGLAVSGLAGVVFALFLSEAAPSGPLKGSHGFYFWWSLISLGGLGLLVALQPALTHLWIHENGEDSRDSG